jgi:glutamate-1-semialdehyde aminotransferase
MLKQGIRLSSNGRIHLSSAHTDEDIDKTVAAAAAVLPTL